jgi:hypothetical protein
MQNVTSKTLFIRTYPERFGNQIIRTFYFIISHNSSASYAGSVFLGLCIGINTEHNYIGLYIQCDRANVLIE